MRQSFGHNIRASATPLNCGAKLVACAVLFALAGCQEKKEPLLRIETPRAKIEVDKTDDGGNVEIHTERPVEPSSNP